MIQNFYIGHTFVCCLNTVLTYCQYIFINCIIILPHAIYSYCWFHLLLTDYLSIATD